MTRGLWMSAITLRHPRRQLPQAGKSQGLAAIEFFYMALGPALSRGRSGYRHPAEPVQVRYHMASIPRRVAYVLGKVVRRH
jgi:hypothetical protein